MVCSIFSNISKFRPYIHTATFPLMGEVTVIKAWMSPLNSGDKSCQLYTVCCDLHSRVFTMLRIFIGVYNIDRREQCMFVLPYNLYVCLAALVHMIVSMHHCCVVCRLVQP